MCRIVTISTGQEGKGKQRQESGDRLLFLGWWQPLSSQNFQRLFCDVLRKEVLQYLHSSTHKSLKYSWWFASIAGTAVRTPQTSGILGAQESGIPGHQLRAEKDLMSWRSYSQAPAFRIWRNQEGCGRHICRPSHMLVVTVVGYSASSVG